MLKKEFLYLFLIFPFFEPQLFKEFREIDNIFSVYKIIAFCIGVYLCIKSRKISKILILIYFYQMTFFISTIYNTGDLKKLLGPMVSVLAMSTITEVGLKKLGINYIKLLNYLLFSFLIINLITVLIYPSGITQNFNLTPVYFLGIDNRFVFMMLPSITISILYSILKYNKIIYSTWLVLIITIFTLVYVWSVGALLGIITMIFYLFIASFASKITKLLNYSSMILSVIIGNILIIFVKIQEYFEKFIVEVLKKDITLSGRTILWEKTIRLLENKLIVGRGILSNEFLINYYKGNSHPHNLILNILLQGGIIALIIYMCILFLLGKKIKKIKNGKIRGLFSIIIFVILFLSIVDTFDVGIVYLLFIIIYRLELDRRVR